MRSRRTLYGLVPVKDLAGQMKRLGNEVFPNPSINKPDAVN
ncbi:MAG: hypothetical protein ACXVPN_00385 [Bacteroidia bacterium]